MATLKYYAQTDALGFPIPGVMMSAAEVPAQANIIEITKEMTLPQHPGGLKYYVRLDKNGNILPNSLFVNYNTLTDSDVVSLQQTPQAPEAPAPTGIAVKVSRNQMGDTAACDLTQTNLTIQITSGTSMSDALTITGDFASLGAYFTPANPNDGMAQPPSFRVAYVVNGVSKNRQFRLTAVGVASGADPMSGTTQETNCASYWIADRYNIQLGCDSTIEQDLIVVDDSGTLPVVGKFYHAVGNSGDTYVIKSRTTPGMASATIEQPGFDTCAASFV